MMPTSRARPQPVDGARAEPVGGRSTVAAIAGSIVVLVIATAVTKSFALGKELVVARTFGVDGTLEAYLLALVVCMFLIGLVAHLLPSALIPVLVRHLENGRHAAARDLVGSTSAFAVAFALACAAAIACLSGPLVDAVGAGFEPPMRELTRRLLLWLLPTVPLVGLTAVWAAVLHARRRFWAVSLVPAVTPLVVVSALLVGESPARVDTLALATVLGLTCETLIMGAFVGHAGFLAPLRLRWRDPSFREVLREYAPIAAGAVLLGLTPVCDRAVAASVGEGAVATLGYAGRVVDATLAIGATAIGTAILPHAARTVALGRREDMKRTFRGLVALVLVVSVPLTAVLALSSEVLVRVLFQGGAFTEADAEAVASVQAVLALQIPIYLVGIIAARVLVAGRRSRVLFVGNLASLLLTIVLDLTLVGPFGVAGVAAATAVTRILVTLGLLVACVRFVFASEPQP